LVEFVSKEAKEYFMVQRKEKLGKLQAKLQPTIIILTNVNIPKEIFNPTTPQ
jgi:glutaredoxin 2